MAIILIIEDEKILAENIGTSLSLLGHETTIAPDGERGLALAPELDADIILLDYRLPSMDGIEVLQRLRHGGCTATIVMMTAHGDIQTAVAAMKAGASHFLKKPVDLNEIRMVTERAVEARKLSDRLSYFRDRERAASAIENIIGSCEGIRAAKAWIQRITTTDALTSAPPPSVLITGETGTGKDLVARAIHYGGPRHEAQFVHVNCTSIPTELFESELFGHVRGAFTDAQTERRGLFEVADGGTIFLDEIGHMGIDLQAKLLSVLDTSTIRPVGSDQERKINVHVIAATNRDLPAAIKEHDFREDLYHRLRVLSVHLPPLRERHEDTVQLARHFLDDVTRRYGYEPRQLATATERQLLLHQWPGNIRELLHVIESAVLLCDGTLIEPGHLNLPAAKSQQLHIVFPTSERKITCELKAGGSLLDDLEREVLNEALEYSKHNVSKAARLLGISRDVIRYRMTKRDSEET